MTSEAVLTELLNTFSKGPHLRNLAVKLVDNLKQRKSVVVFESNSELFNAAYDKYKKYTDKDWGFTGHRRVTPGCEGRKGGGRRS